MTIMLTEAERAHLESLVRAPFDAGGQCPFCAASGDPEPDMDWHEPACPVREAKRILEINKDLLECAAEIQSYRERLASAGAVL